MNLIQKLAEPPVTRPLGKSVMDLWVESRSENEQAAILVAASNPVWGHVALLRELVAEGAPDISDTAFRQWRMKRGLK